MKLARQASKIGKPTLGATEVAETPIAIRSYRPLGVDLEDEIRKQLTRDIGHAALVLERGTVRFEDDNGPRGGVDTTCRIELTMSGRPALVVSKRAASETHAFALAVKSLESRLDRTAGKHRLHTGRRSSQPRPQPQPEPGPAMAALSDKGEIIGRRVGRGPAALERALARPEKTNRAVYVDTALPGVSASDRRVGGGMSARRNTLIRMSRCASSLEDSRTRPSRKSTRRTANGTKPSSTVERAAAARMQRPGARHARRG